LSVNKVPQDGQALAGVRTLWWPGGTQRTTQWGKAFDSAQWQKNTQQSEKTRAVRKKHSRHVMQQSETAA